MNLPHFLGGSETCKVITCSHAGRARMQTRCGGDEGEDDDVTARKISSRESWSSTRITVGPQALAPL